MVTYESFKGIPIEYESFLIKKYNSFITTCRYVEVNYPHHDINYFIVYDDGKLIELLVYGNNGNTARCFNSLVSIDQNIILEFSQSIFNKHPEITKIEIVASYIKYNLSKTILSFKSDDYILKLPSSMEDYYSKLGKSTRQHVKNRKVRLSRDYLDTKFITKFGTEIDEALVNKIVQLKIKTLKSMGRIPKIDDVYKTNMYKYSQYYGCVAYIEIDGEIVAGNLSTIINKEIFGDITAYDSNFSKYSIGEICAFYIIETAIENGLSTFHFLWGESDLKKRLLGQQHLLYTYQIFRNYSINYYYNKIVLSFSNTILDFKRSKFSKPFKKVLKFYVKKISKE